MNTIELPVSGASSWPDTPFPVYIGWDGREEDAYRVCRKSLLARSTSPLHIVPLKREPLSWPGNNGLFTRTSRLEGNVKIDDRDGRPQSTDFAHLRFLVPIIQQYDGWALFQDCDMMWRADIAELLALRDDRYAVMCVKHKHVARETVKMDGQPQQNYHRKNWSSFVLWNCAHPANRNLTREHVNMRSGAWLHGFEWLDDEEIGELGPEWNFLVGYTQNVEPKVCHFTSGTPVFDNYRAVQFADEWWREYNR